MRTDMPLASASTPVRHAPFMKRSAAAHEQAERYSEDTQTSIQRQRAATCSNRPEPR